MLKLPPDRGPLVASLLALAGPIALQNLIGSSLNLVDNVMIGSMGAKSIAGVALANQLFFLLTLFFFALGSGAAIFTAQYWGKNDIAAIRGVLGLALTVMTAGALVFFGASQLMPGTLIGIFSPDPEVIAIGSRFLRIASWGFLFQAVSLGFASVLRSIERVRLPLAASAISLALNTFLNWALIFGHLGLPAMGVRGSAIATAIARFLEMAIIVVAVYARRRPDGSRQILAARPRELFRLSMDQIRKFWIVVLPVVGNEVGWALGFMVPAIVFAHLGTSYIAAYNIADTAIKLVIVVFLGTTNASAILVGKRIGEGRHEEAYATANFLALLAPFMGAIMGLALAGCSLFVPLLFNVGASVRALAALGMVIFALDMPLRVFNWHVIVGILRAGGDTRYSMLLDVGGTWLVSVPLCVILGLVLGLPYWIVYAATLAEDLPKVFMGVARLRSGKWLNNLTVHGEAEGTVSQ
jgi:putative MATE family efflux protein